MPESVLQELERTFVFKRATVIGHGREDSPTLRELLSAAVSALNSPNQREWKRDESERHTIMTVMNYVLGESRSVFCELMKTFPGQPTFAAEHDATKNRYRLLEIQPPSDTAEFVRGVLFFYCYGNGVIIMPTNTFKANELEGYLTWLLRTANVILPEGVVSLNDEALSIVEENIEHLSGASSVCLSASMADLLNFRSSELGAAEGRFAEAAKGIAQVINEAASEIRPGVRPIQVSEEGSGSDLDIVIEVKLPPRLRSTEHVLDALAVASRSFSGVRWSASLKSGFRLGAGRSQVARHKKVLHENRYPSYADARHKMVQTMQELIDSGLIGFLGVQEE
jgi:hypothetical protein